MATNLHYTALIEGIIYVGLHKVIDSDATMCENGLGLIAADAVKDLHDKVKQLGGLLDLAHDSFVIVARYPVIVSAIGHNFLMLLSN